MNCGRERIDKILHLSSTIFGSRDNINLTTFQTFPHSPADKQLLTGGPDVLGYVTAAGPRQLLDPESVVVVVEFGTGPRKWPKFALVGYAAAVVPLRLLHTDETTAVALNCYLRTGARGDDVGGERVVAAIVPV